MEKLKIILQRVLGIGPIQYDIVFKNISTPGKFIIQEANCFIFINQGASTVTVNNSLTIPPGRSLSIPGELFEIYDGAFNINFSTGSGNLVAVIKQYR